MQQLQASRFVGRCGDMTAFVDKPDLICKHVHGCPCPIAMYWKRFLCFALSRHPFVAAVPDQYHSFFNAGPLKSPRAADTLQSEVPAASEIQGQDSSAACLTVPALSVCTGCSCGAPPAQK